jgi:serine/threonine protein phosphatase PrpC
MISRRTPEEIMNYKSGFSQNSIHKSSKLKTHMKKIALDEQVMRQWKATPLSFDHKPTRPDEKKRILGTGLGSVSKLVEEDGKAYGPYRVFDKFGVDGGLAISRSIGDHELTKYGVIPDPEFTEHEITDRDKAIILASDGVWEFLSNEDILQLTHKV